MNVNKHLFNLRKIKRVEMECILERKECRFLFKRNKPKGIWVSNNSLLTVSWVSIDNSMLTEEVFISLLINTILLD